MANTAQTALFLSEIVVPQIVLVCHALRFSSGLNVKLATVDSSLSPFTLDRMTVGTMSRNIRSSAAYVIRVDRRPGWLRCHLCFISVTVMSPSDRHHWWVDGFPQLVLAHDAARRLNH